MRISTIAIAATTAMILSACQSSNNFSSRPPVVAAKPMGAEGTWVDANGIATSTLSNGVFESLANDTGGKLSDGFYTYRDATSIDLTINSVIRGTTSNATCILVTRDQLNCTNSAGTQFVLLRKQTIG